MDQDFNKTVEELLKSGKSADKLDKEQAQLFELLLKHPGWQSYVALVDKRIQLFADEVMAPAGSVDRAIALEYIKGAMSGLIMARDLPSVIVVAMKATVPAADGDDE